MLFWYWNSRSFSILSTDISRSCRCGLFESYASRHAHSWGLSLTIARAKKNAVFVCGQWIASRLFAASWKAICEARRFTNGEARKAVLPTTRRSFMIQLSFHASSSSFPVRIITPGITYVPIMRYYRQKRDKRSAHGRLKIITRLASWFAYTIYSRHQMRKSFEVIRLKNLKQKAKKFCCIPASC